MLSANSTAATITTSAVPKSEFDNDGALRLSLLVRKAQSSIDLRLSEVMKATDKWSSMIVKYFDPGETAVLHDMNSTSPWV